MKRIKVVFYLTFIILGLIFMVRPKETFASEGEYLLRNLVGGPTRCKAYSVLFEDSVYKILITCRDVIYPGGEEVFTYVLWANPTQGGAIIKLGELGRGKAEFKTNTSFSSLFVTKEIGNPRTPTGPTILQGNREVSEIDQNLPTPESTPESELGPSEATPSPTPSARPQNLATRVVASSGAFAFVLLVGIIVVIFVITRQK